MTSTPNNTADKDRAVAETLAELLNDKQLPTQAREAIQECITELVNVARVHSNATDLLHINLPLVLARLRKHQEVPSPSPSDKADSREVATTDDEPFVEPQPLTRERAAELMDRIMRFIGHEDDIVRALIVLIHGVVYERSLTEREGFVFTALGDAFRHTDAFDAAFERFASEPERRT